MTFEEYIPLKLNGLVDRIWSHKTDSRHSWTILPSGKIELMFRIGEAPELIGAKKISSAENPMQHFCFMSGLQTSPLAMTMDSMHFIGMQMHPVAFKAFFGIPLAEIRDYYLPGEHLFSALVEIEDRLNGKQSFFEKASWLENYLHSRINETPELHFAIQLSQYSEKIYQPHTVLSNASIEALIGYSRTQTFRIFNDWFGTSPHGFQRLQQFVNSVKAIHRSNENFTQIGLQNGFFDQPHFIRSFKKFAGITPGQYRSRMTHIPGQISA